MAIVTTDSKNYSDIADAIRSKGVSGSFKPAQMAAAIEQIEGGAGGDYNIEAVDDGAGGQILNITDAGSGGGTEITLTSAVVNWLEFLEAVFPNYPNGFEGRKRYFVAAEKYSTEAGAILACSVITSTGGAPKFTGCRYWGGAPTWGTNTGTTVQADAAVGDKFILYEV